jgi:hypothetical protein
MFVDSENSPEVHCRCSILCCRSDGHSARERFLACFFFCSFIPAEGRVCQHTRRAPIKSISTLNSSGGVSVPVVDCVRELFVGLERRMRRTKLEGVITCSLWVYRCRLPISLLSTLGGTRNKTEPNSRRPICGKPFVDKGVKGCYRVCQVCL